jgi:hypothetical protein
VKVSLLEACDDPRLFNFKLWPKQRELLEQVERGPRLHCWALGRRSGKTTMTALIGLWTALFRPRSPRASGTESGSTPSASLST